MCSALIPDDMKPWEASAQVLMDKKLLGTLDAGDAAQFEAALQDPDFREEWDLRLDLHQAFLAEGRAQVLAEFRALEAAHFPSAKVVSMAWLRRPAVWAAAAVVLLLAVFSLIRFTGQAVEPEALYAAHFQPYPNTVVVIPRDQGTLSDPLAQAMDAYQRADYPTAIAMLDTLSGAAERPDLQFYRSLSLLATGRTAEAIPAFEALVEAPTHAFSRESRWYLALAFLRNAQVDQARPLLRDLAAQDDNPNQAGARAILEAVD
ncbi:MAG: hypothetical protein D6722_00215 [Bacteroidetes bacterium]|nr:MAG: hypothetical protein D6722_00215 [Bacteroidota bacterium]